jgi:hypothetical protein
VGFAVSEDDRVTEGEKTNMKTLIVAFRNLYSNRTEELTSKMIKITVRYNAAEVVAFVHLPDIKFDRSDSYWPIFVEAGRSVAWQISSLIIVWKKGNSQIVILTFKIILKSLLLLHSDHKSVW